MNYAEVKELIAIVNHSLLTNFELNMDNVSIKMSKNKDAVISHITEQNTAQTVSIQTAEVSVPDVSKEIKQEEPVGNIVKSPIVGTFYAAPGSDKPSFVTVGDKVKEGDTLCIVEAMKIMNEIPSPYNGEIAEIYVVNEEFVEYGQPLFKIKKR